MSNNINNNDAESIVEKSVDDYIYFIGESGNFCPRGMLINVSKMTNNLKECLDKLFAASIEISPKYYEYTKKPYIKISNNAWKQDENLPETDLIVNALIHYANDSPLNRHFDGIQETDEPTGFPPLYVNGWYDHAFLDVYRYYCYKKIDDPYPTEYNGIKINIIKKIYVIEPALS
jgi:hypothetical protein